MPLHGQLHLFAWVSLLVLSYSLVMIEFIMINISLIQRSIWVYVPAFDSIRDMWLYIELQEKDISVLSYPFVIYIQIHMCVYVYVCIYVCVHVLVCPSLSAINLWIIRKSAFTINGPHFRVVLCQLNFIWYYKKIRIIILKCSSTWCGFLGVAVFYDDRITFANFYKMILLTACRLTVGSTS